MYLRNQISIAAFCAGFNLNLWSFLCQSNSWINRETLRNNLFPSEIPFQLNENWFKKLMAADADDDIASFIKTVSPLLMRCALSSTLLIHILWGINCFNETFENV